MGNFVGSSEERSQNEKKWEATITQEWKDLVQEDKDKYHQQSSNLFSSALAGENVDKNRYQSVLALDQSRVRLQPQNGTTSDYINANFIDGIHSRSKRAYIATQAPKPETIKDFWRMVWEQDVHILIMLTNLEERGKHKADQYWPKSASKTYGTITVSCHGEDQENEYWVLRQFTIRTGANSLKTATTMIRTGLDAQPTPKSAAADSRIIFQYHYKAWPDMGVPMPLPLLKMMNEVNQCWLKIIEKSGKQSQKEDPDLSLHPILVHCSAGIGRTGAYILINSCITKLLEEGSQNTDNLALRPILSAMRDQRPGLVQQKDQYIFCYQAIKSAIRSDPALPMVGLSSSQSITSTSSPLPSSSSLPQLPHIDDLDRKQADVKTDNDEPKKKPRTRTGDSKKTKTDGK